MFGALFSLFLLGGTFYGGLYLGVKSQTSPVLAPIARALILREENKEKNTVDMLLDFIFQEGEQNK